MKMSEMKNEVSLITTAELLKKIDEMDKRLCECERLLKAKGQQLQIDMSWHPDCKDEEQQGGR